MMMTRSPRRGEFARTLRLMTSAAALRRILGLAVALAAAARSAYAQPGTAAIAEQLFDEGRELARSGRWALACPMFEASLRIEPALGAHLNLATCYENLGKPARAWGLYREVIDLAGKAGDVQRRDYAQSHAAALEPRLARLTIAAPVAAPIDRPAGFLVRWDGSPVPPGALGVDLYADPGPHEITAAAPGFETFTKTVTLVEGNTLAIAVPVLAAAAVPAAELPAASPEDATRDLVIVSQRLPDAPIGRADRSSPRRTLAIGLGAAGLTTAGVGLWFGVKARSRARQARQRCGEQLVCNTVADLDAGRRLIHNARSDATVSTVLVAAGGAAIVGGVLVLLATPRTREQTTATLAPLIDDHGVGLAVVGKF